MIASGRKGGGLIVGRTHGEREKESEMMLLDPVSLLFFSVLSLPLSLSLPLLLDFEYLLLSLSCWILNASFSLFLAGF